MCIGIPMIVIQSEGYVAQCEGRGERRMVDLSLIGAQTAGTYVLVFLDAAREVISAERATEIDAAIDGLDAALRGDVTDFDKFFPDLANREPELPEFLKKEAAAHANNT